VSKRFPRAYLSLQEEEELLYKGSYRMGLMSLWARL